MTFDVKAARAKAAQTHFLDDLRWDLNQACYRVEELEHVLQLAVLRLENCVTQGHEVRDLKRTLSEDPLPPGDK